MKTDSLACEGACPGCAPTQGTLNCEGRGDRDGSVTRVWRCQSATTEPVYGLLSSPVDFSNERELPKFFFERVNNFLQVRFIVRLGARYQSGLGI